MTNPPSDNITRAYLRLSDRTRADVRELFMQAITGHESRKVSAAAKRFWRKWIVKGEK